MNEGVLMRKEKALGFVILVISSLIIVIYPYLIFFAGEEMSLFITKVTVTLIVGIVSLMALWIGYTLITTPTQPEEIRRIDEEISKEIKKLEEEYKKE